MFFFTPMINTLCIPQPFCFNFKHIIPLIKSATTRPMLPWETQETSERVSPPHSPLPHHMYCLHWSMAGSCEHAAGPAVSWPDHTWTPLEPRDTLTCPSRLLTPEVVVCKSVWVDQGVVYDVQCTGPRGYALEVVMWCGVCVKGCVCMWVWWMWCKRDEVSQCESCDVCDVRVWCECGYWWPRSWATLRSALTPLMQVEKTRLLRGTHWYPPPCPSIFATGTILEGLGKRR